ncbi:MAG: lipoyl synthase [Thermodesulfovibrionales bacterium]|nr:lipoyl synthase [Thermodesulfovibrionales bacterium]
MLLPPWFKIKISKIQPTLKSLRKYALHTVCEEAKCPNKNYCFSYPTATFLILGDVCTRKCSFCSIKSGIPKGVDDNEPYRIVEASKEMGLNYIVITSVSRDDLEDGGALHFAKTIRVIKEQLPHTKIEVLTPDFLGNQEALSTVISSAPDVFNHNIETVKRLYPLVRPQADYMRSLRILSLASKLSDKVRIKSGLMIGLGETEEEIIETLVDLKKCGCNFVTIGQYLRPTKKNIPVQRFFRPEEFDRLKEIAYSIGFDQVASGPLVRSSMNAQGLYRASQQ